jgi:HD-GYP domain-containing protein (c-di-GMP phosphodiesterase class II)
MTIFKINLHQAVYSLSNALDLVGVTHIHHGKRVAYIAAECAKVAGWPAARLDALFQAAILHDCGVSKTVIHARLAQLEWENEIDHCLLGAELLQSSALLAPLADIVLHHHTHWSELKDRDLPDHIKLASNCIYMADRIDVSCLTPPGKEPNILLLKGKIRDLIADRRGEWFNSDLVDCFMDVSRSEAFWFALENEHVEGYLARWLSHASEVDMAFSELRRLVHVFSRIVDAKSSFTREHSEGVASLARFIGTLFALPERTCEMLELAGLLHDIGKLRVPDQLLEKNGKLDAQEYAMVQRHSFDTYNILREIHGLEDVALWAGQHHERVNGSGYPYHQRGSQISQEARIVAIADVFQALAQTRPYRDAMPMDDVLGVLKDQVAAGKLDAQIVSQVEDNLEACWIASLAH